MKIGNFEINGFAALAPMAGVADRAFRELCIEFGASYVVTEMVSSKGLTMHDRKSDSLMQLGETEKPAAVQIFGCDPEAMAQAAKKAAQTGCTAIDINMGCPAPKIAGNGGGSALMKDPVLAARITEKCVEAVDIPVTVKIRSGWDETGINAVQMAQMLENAGAAAITVHGRTRKQMYAPPVNLDIIRQVKQAVRIPVIGNGDIFTAPQALERMRQSGVDGIMVARGAQGNPWIFRDILALLQGRPLPPAPSGAEKLSVALEHAQMLCKLRGERVAIPALRKHMCSYLKGTHGVGAAREAVCHAESYSRLEEIMSRALMKCGE